MPTVNRMFLPEAPHHPHRPTGKDEPCGLGLLAECSISHFKEPMGPGKRVEGRAPFESLRVTEVSL